MVLHWMGSPYVSFVCNIKSKEMVGDTFWCRRWRRVEIFNKATDGIHLHTSACYGTTDDKSSEPFIDKWKSTTLIWTKIHIKDNLDGFGAAVDDWYFVLCTENGFEFGMIPVFNIMDPVFYLLYHLKYTHMKLFAKMTIIIGLHCVLQFGQ